MKKLFVLSFLFSHFSQASSSGFPTKEIFFQVFNFSIFLILLIVFLSRPLKQLFKNRKKDYLLYEEQARKQKQKMQQEISIWEAKIQELDNKQKTIKEQAKKEGEKLLVQKEEELNELKNRLAAEQDFFTNLESEKIRRDSFKKWQMEIVKRAQDYFQKNPLSSEANKKMTKEFLNQVEEQA